MAVLPDSSAAPMTLEDLADALADCCQGGSHWSHDAVVKHCGLAQDELASAVKSWWGEPQPWLDLLATELVRGLAPQLGLERRLGAAWAEAAEAWVEEAYAAAAAAPDAKPPQLSVLGSRAGPLARRVLASLGGAAPAAPAAAAFAPTRRAPQAKPAVAAAGPPLCERCGRPRSLALGRCVACPPAGQPAQPQPTPQLVQDPRAQFRRTKPENGHHPPPCDRCRRPISVRLGRCVNCASGAPAAAPEPPPRRSSSSSSSGSGSAPPPDAEQLLQDWRAYPSAPLEESSWDDLLDVLWARGGSGGVGLLRRESGVVCVKKCCPEELFAQRLASALGVRVASMRLVDSYGEEASELRKSVRSIEATAGEGAKVPIRGILRFELLVLLEFLDGVGMMGVPAHERLKALQGSGDATRWRELGRLMAFDMLINNLDRLPLAWTNEGNLTNVMVGGAAGAFVGIDQSAAPILFEQGLTTYLSRVRQAAKEARCGEAAAFGRVFEAIFNNTAIQLEASEKAELRRGCWDFVQDVAAKTRDSSLETLLGEIALEVRGHFSGRQNCEEVMPNVVSLVTRVAAVMAEEAAQ